MLVTEIPNLRHRLAATFVRRGGRPTLFAVAVMNLITGVGLAMINAGREFGGDSGLYRQCALVLAEGRTDFCGFLYSPLMALAARPLSWVPAVTAEAAMSLVGVGIVLAGVTLETRGQARIDRMLVAVAALTFAPVVYELLLGQTTLLIAATVYPIARQPDRMRNGIPFGIALALAPKPLLLPLLLWMLVWRRRALTATVITGLVMTGLGVIVLGLAPYRDWLAVLLGAGRETAAGTFILSARDTGNFSVWPLTPVTVALAVVVGASTLWVIRRDASRGFVASLFAGLLLAPYSLLYAFSILLLAVKPALEFAPRTTSALALTANLVRSVPVLFVAWSVVGLGACLLLRAPWARGLQESGEESGGYRRSVS